MYEGELHRLLTNCLSLLEQDSSHNFFLGFNTSDDTYCIFDFSLSDDVHLFNKDDDFTVVGKLTFKGLKRILKFSDFDYFLIRLRDVAQSGIPTAMQFDLSSLAF